MQCNHIHCKCNHNQQLLSLLHKIIYHVISCQIYGLVCKAKDNNRTDLPIVCLFFGENPQAVAYSVQPLCLSGWETSSPTTHRGAVRKDGAEILPIDGLLSYLYTWWFVSLLLLWTWKENVSKHCFRCCSYYKSYKQAFQINWCCFHMVKPNLVTKPAIVHGFFVTLSF